MPALHCAETKADKLHNVSLKYLIIRAILLIHR